MAQILVSELGSLRERRSKPDTITIGFVTYTHALCTDTRILPSIQGVPKQLETLGNQLKSNTIVSSRIISVDRNRTRFIKRERKSSYIIIERFPIFTQNGRPMGSRAKPAGPLIYFVFGRLEVYH